MTGPATLADYTVPTITAAAERAGRPRPADRRQPADLRHLRRRRGARTRAAKDFQIYGFLPSYRAMLDREGAAGPADVAIVGDEATVTKAIGELADAGVTEFVASIFGSARGTRGDPRAAEVDALSGRRPMTDDPRSPLELLEALDRGRSRDRARLRGTSRSTRCAACSRCSGTARSTRDAGARDVRRRHGQPARPGRRPLPRPRRAARRATASARSASATASPTISRAACTTWPRPPTSPGGAARGASS